MLKTHIKYWNFRRYLSILGTYVPISKLTHYYQPFSHKVDLINPNIQPLMLMSYAFTKTKKLYRLK